MKILCLQNIYLFIALSVLSPLMADNDICDFDGKVVKYVQGGACQPNKGTKKHPYGTLAQAQADASWEVLIVLSSHTSLDGGITLKPGQALIGDTCPTSRILRQELPIITNSSNALNGGNGVFVTGDARIENIYFQDTFASAINYDNTDDLTVKNVLITGHNQGSISGAAGIKGECAKSGSTCIENVVIHHNRTGNGISDLVKQGAHRNIEIDHSELYSLSSSEGILLRTLDSMTTSHVHITNCYLHNFTSSSATGIACTAGDGSVMNAIINDVKFLDIVGPNGGYHIQSLEFGNAAVSSVLNLNVCSCVFEETKSYVFPENALYVQNYSSAGGGEVTIEKCRCTNLSFFVVSANFDDFKGSTQKIKILDNIVDKVLLFYQAFNAGSLAGTHGITETTIENNLLNGASAIEVLVDDPWLQLVIFAKNNCFIATPGSAAALDSFTFNTNDAGNATIYARCNTFEGFNVDISDFNANVNYIVPRNWWGPGTSCPPPCGPYQVCQDGKCLGPDPVSVEPGYTGTIVANNPLAESIKCPHLCCPRSLSPHVFNANKMELLSMQPERSPLSFNR